MKTALADLYHVGWIVLGSLLLLGYVLSAATVYGQALPQARLTVSLADLTVSGTATLVRAANQSRMALSCKNTASTDAIRIGDSTTTATRGVQVNGGESFIVTNTDALYAASIGSSVTLTCTESLR